MRSKGCTLQWRSAEVLSVGPLNGMHGRIFTKLTVPLVSADPTGWNSFGTCTEPSDFSVTKGGYLKSQRVS